MVGIETIIGVQEPPQDKQNKTYHIKTIKCTKQACVFIDHFGKDIDDAADSLVICLVCNHKSME